MNKFDLRLLRGILLVSLSLLSTLIVTAQPLTYGTDRYHNPDESAALLRAVGEAHPAVTRLHSLAKGFSGDDYLLLEVGSEVGSVEKTRPAILVVANLEGTAPLAGEAALFLINDLLANPVRYQTVTWYILACGNADAAWRFFRKPHQVESRNLRPYNDDMDDQTDEDGPEDLNGDGLITVMRVKDPDGMMMVDPKDPRLMKRADPSKGERGVYKVYTEGIDNDGDGQYNEDGPGGTNLGITFPHLYPHNQAGAGLWPGSEPEVHALMAFITAHPEIALTMTYGSTNFCLTPPRGGRKTTMSLTSIRLPQRYARMLNADPEKSYSLEEVKEMLKTIVPPGTTVDDAMVAGMLDMGAVVNPLEADLKFYQAFSDQFKKHLKEKGLTQERLEPARDKDGSFELWAYYHLGLPSFSMDLWRVPSVKDTTNQEKGVKNKEERVGDPLEEAFMAYNDNVLKGKGFVPWTEFRHSQLGMVEIGGVVPFADLAPPAERIDTLLTVQVPWIYQLVEEIPGLKVTEARSEPQGGGIHRVTIWVRNERKLPFPTAMGQRNKAPAPAIITLKGKGIEFISGRARTVLDHLNAGEQKKFTWLIRSDKPVDLVIGIEVKNAFGDTRTIQTGGK
ncbi:MAG: M14 family metallopeptidase [Bacteroidales bacterium]